MARPRTGIDRVKWHWARTRAQARRRGEPWDPEFTRERWREIWGEHWQDRGRGLDDYNMIRIDFELPWMESNVLVCRRRDYITRQGCYYRPRDFRA